MKHLDLLEINKKYSDDTKRGNLLEDIENSSFKHEYMANLRGNDQASDNYLKDCQWTNNHMVKNEDLDDRYLKYCFNQSHS